MTLITSSLVILMRQKLNLKDFKYNIVQCKVIKKQSIKKQ